MMKLAEPKKYYKSQHSKFKKIKKYTTNRGEKVRTLLEKQIANRLHKLNINYECEPLIKTNEKYFFPDFLINKKIIIECASGKGETKAYKIKEKIEHLKKDYRVFVIIPKNLHNSYKILDNYLIKKIEELSKILQS